MKVMISLPPETVEKLDAIAAQRDMTRSGTVAALADSEYERIREARRRAVLDAMGPAGAFDGRAAEHVAADRRR